MDDLTVADELAFDALDEATRTLCNKIVESRLIDEEEVEERGYTRGYRKGREARDERKEELERDVVKLNGVIKALEDQLTHHKITPNRQYGVPATTPALDASMLAAKPRNQADGKAAD